MASTYETILGGVLDRLKVAGNGWPAATKIRRSHRTIVTRENAPAVHLIDGPDAPSKQRSKGDCADREATFTVSVFVRSDDIATADPLKVEIMRRLNPTTEAYPAGVSVYPGRIAVETEVADTDAVRVDMEFTVAYPAAEWALS